MLRDQVDRAPDTRVMLLRDLSWPDAAGVCCWRHGVRAAFESAGAQIDDATIQPAAAEPPAEGTPGTGRAARLPRVVRRPAALAYRGARQVTRSIAREVRSRSGAARRSRAAARRLAERLDGADLVIAESPGAAEAALSLGATGGRLWVLALPPERLYASLHTGYSGQIARIAPRLGGFLADSELARESIERAAADCRPRVEIFPPLATDRACPECGSMDSPSTPHQPDGPGQLATWRRLLHTAAEGARPAAYSFPASRLLGQAADWAPASWLDWSQERQGVSRRIAAAEAATGWTSERQARAADRVLVAALPARSATGRRSRKTLVSGYDLKFVGELGARLDNRTDLNVTLDSWPYLGHRSAQTDRLLADADSVFAEWARPSAVWLSQHKRPGQLLVVRLHRYELDCPYPRDIDIDKVDAVVHISSPIGKRIRDELGWPAEKLVYIPNYLDTDWLDRPKLPGARFGIGFVGMEFMNKRFDLALDVLTEVRGQDPRFSLHVRSVMPWDNVYAWPRDEEREYVGWCMERIERDPLLRGAVRFDRPGRDMARWYRRVGHVLSMSDIESFHLAAAEGMASGAVPVIRPWPGATEIYGKEWIHPSVEAAAETILASADASVWAERAGRAREEIRASADPVATVEAWADLLHGDVAGARRRFAPFTMG
jgi:glycosyltransferase involved in cell wall biosynthesis